jgi:acyl-CoA reductase-like NAD-dependent aldehyde dehydrogenase
MDLEERIALCQRFMDEFEKHRDQIALDITGQVGKPLAHAQGEVNGMYERCVGMMAQSRAALAPDVLPLKDNFVRRIEKVCTSMSSFMCTSMWCVAWCVKNVWCVWPV